MNKILLTKALEILISDSRNGIRVQPNGNPLSSGSIANYNAVLRNIMKFEQKKQKIMSITASTSNNARLNKSQVFYWQRFYRDYRKFLYRDCDAHDNYVALHMRVLKLVFRYLRNNKFFPIGNYEYIFYSSRVNCTINIFPIELLGTVIHEYKSYILSPRQHKILAVFLFGIAVGLRYSDLQNLSRQNIVIQKDGCYLQTVSRKTATACKVKLPPYAYGIMKEYGTRNGSLFSLPALQNFNYVIREIARNLEWSWPVQVTQSKNGRIKIKNDIRFHDIISSHMMRRTCISALLSQGIPETVVRQISGHAPGSKEFHKYVHFSQVYIDKRTDQAWEKILTPE